MSNSDELAIREAISWTHGSFLSGVVQSRLLQSGLTGASHPAYESEGYDLDDVPDSEDIEGLSESTATDDEAEVQGHFFHFLPRRLFHAGLGSLGVLPPEIRLQIWEMIIPTIKFCIQLETEQCQKLRMSDLLQARRPDQPKIESLKTLGILSASKQIYHEIDTHIYHNHSPVSDRSLVIIFTTTCDPSARRVSLERARSSNPRLVLDGTCPSGALPFKNFAAFTSTKLLIELPGPIASFHDFEIITRSVRNFSHQFRHSQLARRRWRGWPSRSARIEMAICTRMQIEDIWEERDNVEYEPSLLCLARLLEPIRSIKNSAGATVEADYDLRYGKEWLPELLSQVANDMQSSRKNRPHQWRQKNMEIALAQCELFTQATPRYQDGGPLPIGLPDALTDDTREYFSEWLDPYDLSDHQIYLDTGELPYRPPGRPVNGDTKFLSWEYLSYRVMKTSTLTRNLIKERRKIRALVLRHQRARRNRASCQSTLLPSESPEPSQEKYSDPHASKDQVPSSEPGEVTSTLGNDQGQPTTLAESTPLIHPWNRYKTSAVPQAKATSPPQPANSSRPEIQPAPAAATMSDREFILKGLLIFIVLAVMHRLLP